MWLAPTKYRHPISRLRFSTRVRHGTLSPTRTVASSCDHNGQPFSGQIAFHQANTPTLLVRLDEKGQCWLDRNSFRLDTDIVADLSSAHAISSPSLPKVTFQLHEGEKEYLLSLRKPASSMTLLEIFLALLGLVFLFFLFILFFV